MNCHSTCKKSVLSDTGCKCINPKEAKKGWCYVEQKGCKSLPFIPSGLFGKKYDTVSRKNPQYVCQTINDDYQACDPKMNPSIIKRKILSALTVVGVLSIFGYYKVTSKLNESDEEVASRLLASSLGYLKFQQNQGILSEEEATNIKSVLKSQYERDPLGFIRTILQVTRKTLSKSGQQTPMLDLLLKTIPKQHYGELLRGAHFILPDGGNFYRQFQNIEKTFKRISSHHPKVEDVKHVAATEYVGDTPLHLLSGIDKNGNTWLQLEASPFLEGDKWSEVLTNTLFKENVRENLFYGLEHGFDYIAYVLTKKTKNIGPFGSSAFPERNPIVLTSPPANFKYSFPLNITFSK